VQQRGEGVPGLLDSSVSWSVLQGLKQGSQRSKACGVQTCPVKKRGDYTIREQLYVPRLGDMGRGTLATGFLPRPHAAASATHSSRMLSME
jgi:hypothetical protein